MRDPLHFAVGRAAIPRPALDATAIGRIRGCQGPRLAAAITGAHCQLKSDPKLSRVLKRYDQRDRFTRGVEASSLARFANRRGAVNREGQSARARVGVGTNMAGRA